MYYPLFRGKRFELMAIRDALPKLQTNGKICPIIEPVNPGTGDMVTCLTALQGKIRHAVLVNPGVGKIKKHPNVAANLIAPFLTATNDLIPAFNVASNTTARQLNAFLTLYQTRRVMLLFGGTPPWINALPAHLAKVQPSPILVFINGKEPAGHQAMFQGFDLVLLKDGFHRHQTNAQYPPVTAFSDLHRTYQASGYQGFGDYSIVGFTHRDGGGQAQTVTLHLTEERPIPGPVVTNHFKSIGNTVGNDAGKFLQALNLLVAHVNANPASFTYSLACAEFIALHAARHYPGLGTAKRLSVRHHLELMETLV